MQAEFEKTLASLILALGVIIALFFPQVSHAFVPYLLPALFFVMLFSLFPFVRLEAGELTKLHPVVLSLVAWSQFILPTIVMIAGEFIGLERHILYFILVTVTSGALFASPTLIQLMGLEQKMAVQTVIVSTLAAPVSIYLIFGQLQGGELALDFSLFGFRLLVFLLVPLAFFVLLRTLSKNWNESRKDRLDTIGRWGSVLALVVFCFALEAQVTDAIANEPHQVVKYLLISIAVACGVGLSTRLVMARFGARAASTAMILASFRNVGLTFGLVGQIAGPELAVYVGVCQIPMFFSPLLFDLFVGKSRVPYRTPDAESNQADNASGETAHSHGGETDRPIDGIVTSLPGPASRLSGNSTPAIHQQYLPIAQGGAATALDLNYVARHEAIVEPDKVEKNLEDYLIEGLEVTRDDARALLHRLHQHYKDAESQLKAAAEVTLKTRAAAGYTALFLVLSIAGVAAVWQANRHFSPMLFDQQMIEEVAQAHTENRNFGVFDLNINIRDLRDATISRMKKTPETVVLGASHWQEAHVDLMPGRDFYNSHVHRDYYEDMLAVTEMWVRHGRLPKEMIITVRDNLLTPIKQRGDFLWLPGIKYYRDFARRIGLEPHSRWETLPVNTWRELVSLPLLWSQSSRQMLAPVQPHATDERNFDTLDTLLPGGSILWSGEHRRLFTQERARTEALAFANARRNDPPQIDPTGVRHMEALFDFLVEKGVKVTLAHPQFNPIFWDAVQGSPYMGGLRKIEDLTKSWAKRYGFAMIGGFAPHSVGCGADMYIDAEHGNPTCLGMLLDQYGKSSREPVQQSFEFQIRGSMAN